MVFEYFLGAKDVEGFPLLMFTAGVVYSVVSVPLALFFVPDGAAMLGVSLTTIAAVPLILRIIDFEADLLELYPRSVASRETKIVVLFLWFFFGEVLGFATVYTLMGPEQFQIAAALQLKDLGVVDSVRQSITGDAIGGSQVASIIFSNNLRVYLIGLVLSFIYGTGSVFILSWNASVVGALLAQQVRETGNVISGVLRFLAILPHGIIEYSAYILGGVAGALLSLYIMQRDRSRKLLVDVLLLALSGILLLYIGAIVEAMLIVTG